MVDPAHRAGITANQARWDEAAPLHAASAVYDLDDFRAHPDRIRPFEPDELGPVAGKDLLHLQCHLGTDTLSWAGYGAHVNGLDFSPQAIEIARELAADLGIDATFWCADVYDAVAAVGGRTFDVVYTGIGALGWLPDLRPWAKVVAELLRPGGVLYVLEIHPLVPGVLDDGRTLVQDVFEADFVSWDETGGGTYAAPGAEMEHTISWERVHAISDVLSAVLEAGLTLELFHEQSYTNAEWPWCERGEDGYYRLPAGWPKFPLTYSLRARRP